ncbi:MAG: hypothetical protein COA99_04175 [Moraxellaceae bacterium]|nr:MAG: hypothetical protein COA99_04175 [Moraxellaceae bacterium]
MKDSLSLLNSIKDESKQGKLPPVDSWNPDYCGDSDIVIRHDGSWWHQGTMFKRQKLVELFSRIIRLDDDEKYYLVTPVEKMLLTVEDVPFLVVGFEMLEDDGEQKILFETNVGDSVLVDEMHPISVKAAEDEPAPYVLIRRNLKARVARSVYYQLLEIAKEEKQGKETVMVLESCGQKFELGRY